MPVLPRPAANRSQLILSDWLGYIWVPFSWSGTHSMSQRLVADLQIGYICFPATGKKMLPWALYIIRRRMFQNDESALICGEVISLDKAFIFRWKEQQRDRQKSQHFELGSKTQINSYATTTSFCNMQLLQKLYLTNNVYICLRSPGRGNL